MIRRILTATGAGFALALVGVLGVAQSASAHDRLVQSDPAEGGSVSSLSAVTLTYSASLLGETDQTANLAQVTDAAGRHYETACAAVDGAVVTVPVALGDPGEYTVDWRVVSSDGHPVSGSYSFTWAPEAGAAAAAGADASPCAAIAADPATTGGTDDQTAGLIAGLSAGAVVIGILVVIVMVGLQARKPKAKPAPDDDTEE